MNTINEQFTNATRQYADTAAQVNQLALQNFENVFGLQLSTLETNTRAAFAFWNELVEARDPDAMRNVVLDACWSTVAQRRNLAAPTGY